jgi:16S rRNA (guanine527-N7)-methyltransferase
MITEKKGVMTSKDSHSDGPGSLVDLWTMLSANGIALSKEQMDVLDRYQRDLRYWNERVNMISRKDADNIWDRHIVHSLSLLKYVSLAPKARVLDVGTGGGLPGIPLKIARPDLRVTMVDSIAKKMKMVEMFAKHTELKDLTPVTARAEDLVDHPHYRHGFDVIVSRAVAPISTLVGWTRELLAEGGSFAFLKGGELTSEIEEARQAYADLTVTVRSIDMFGFPHFMQDEKKVVQCVFS